MALRPRTRILCAPLVAAALGAAACGSGSSSTAKPTAHPSSSTGTTPTPTAPFTPPSTTATPSGPAYSVQVAVTGTDSVQGSFSQSVAACAPATNLAGTVQGQRVGLQMPGASPVGQPLPLSPGDIVVIVGGHSWGVASAANAPRASSGTLQRNADGSGSATFQNLALQGNLSQQPQESGTITWTCG